MKGSSLAAVARDMMKERGERRSSQARNVRCWNAARKVEKACSKLEFGGARRRLKGKGGLVSAAVALGGDEISSGLIGTMTLSLCLSLIGTTTLSCFLSSGDLLLSGSIGGSSRGGVNWMNVQ